MRSYALMSGRRTEAGYSLIELSIVMIVVGIFISGFMAAYNVYIKNESQRVTSVNTSIVSQAISNYLAENGRYPCPAGISLPIEHPKYGRETDCANLTGYEELEGGDDYASAALAVGQCNFGICVEESEREFDTDPGPGVTNLRPLVIRGSIPFRDLNLPEEYSFDGYHSRLVYAISRPLVSTTGYNSAYGGIEIRDSAGVSLVTPAASAHFVIVSPGSDRVGSYTKYGQRAIPCAGTSYDIENCDTATRAVYRAARQGGVTASTHFDDYVSYSSSAETPFWKVVDANRVDVTDLTGGKKIGIGREPDAAADFVKVDVREVTRAMDARSTAELESVTDGDRGKVIAENFCGFDTEDQDCFNPELIAGDLPEMECGGLRPAYMTGIGYNAGEARIQADCTDDASFSCPEGYFISGVNPDDGSISCAAAADIAAVERCPERAVTLCLGTPVEQEVTLTEDTIGATRSLTRGWNFYRNYICSSSTGRWQQTSQGGFCECEAGVTEEVLDCEERDGVGTWTGTFTIRYTTICDLGYGEPQYDVDPPDYGGCACTPTFNEEVEPCPDGFGGQEVWRTTWTCNGDNTEGAWSDWEMVSNTCSCTPESRDHFHSCPEGYDGEGILMREDKTCPAYDGDTPSTWGAEYEVESRCTCSSETETRDFDCDEGYSGHIRRERTFDCDTGWGPWTDVVGGNTCACNAEVQGPYATSCPDGFSGSRYVQREITCPGPVIGAWEFIPEMATCSPIIYRWKSIGTPSETGVATKRGQALNSECSPRGARGQCHVVVGTNTYDNYADCECQ